MNEPKWRLGGRLGGRLNYLASPFSSPEPEVKIARYQAAMDATAWLLSRRIWTYSPIVHCYQLALDHVLPDDFEFWHDYNFATLAHCDSLLVLAIDGWKDSKGVQGEIAEAERLDLPIKLLTPAPRTFPPTYIFQAFRSARPGL
jgi:hypothetical protein